VSGELPTGLAERVRDTVRRALGAEVLRVDPLRGQLSNRRFVRVFLDGSGPEVLIARIEMPEDPGGRPAGSTPEPPLEPIRALLEGNGLPVPKRYGGDASAGVELLEDLGSESLTAAAWTAQPGRRRALYDDACDLVPRLQRVADPGTGVAAFARRLDDALFAYKADLFTSWSLPCRGRPASSAERSAVSDAFAHVARVAARAPLRLAHRDLQSANLQVVAGPPERLVMIDLQGAFLAPPEYDLVCLLRDSYVELPEAEVEALCARVRPALPDAPELDAFAHRFDLLTLTRKAKDHARFLYAAGTRGDSRYLPFVPATVRFLRAAAERAALREPELRPLAELVAALPENVCAR
jgi:aminoglycoside/choline kinase family phosphotransferase